MYTFTICRRNESIIGSKATVGKQPGATTIIGDDPKKFAAALVEYSKVQLYYQFIIFL
jgi:hypothetical protein